MSRAVVVGVVASTLVLVALMTRVDGVDAVRVHSSSSSSSSSAKRPNYPIKNVVVLMMENLSYQHVFGWTKFGKLTGNEYNLLKPGDPTSRRYHATRGSPFCTAPVDPPHDTPDVQLQLFEPNPVPTHASSTYNMTMGGFAERYASRKGDPTLVMNGYTAAQMPVANALAEHFTLFDRYFADMPGPTGVNRMFMHTTQTGGYTGSRVVGDDDDDVADNGAAADASTKRGDSDGLPLHVRSIETDMEAEGRSWGIYWMDFTTAHLVKPLGNSPKLVQDLNFTKFFKLAAEGRMPEYSFLVCEFGLAHPAPVYPNSQHPPGDVRAGELLYKNVYEALRASPQWNETLFVLNWDEHGGFWDPATPPYPVANPNASVAAHPYPFTFDRLGVRVPALAISPWLPAAVDSSQFYSHSSIVHTTRKLLGLRSSPMTPREAGASTFEHLLLSQPRTDCPMTLPDIPPGAWCDHPPMSAVASDEQREATSAYASLARLPRRSCRTRGECAALYERAMRVLRERGEIH